MRLYLKHKRYYRNRQVEKMKERKASIIPKVEQVNEFKSKKTELSIRSTYEDYELDEEIYQHYINDTVFKIAEKYDKVKFKILNNIHREYRPIYKFPDGSMYEGQWLKGTNKRDGKGVQVWPDGTRYQGDWMNDDAHGFGQYIEPDSSHSDGEWKNGNQNGYCIEVMANGNVYEGK